MSEYEQLKTSLAYRDFLFDHFNYVKWLGLTVTEAMEEEILFNHFLKEYTSFNHEIIHS